MALVLNSMKNSWPLIGLLVEVINDFENGILHFTKGFSIYLSLKEMSVTYQIIVL